MKARLVLAIALAAALLAGCGGGGASSSGGTSAAGLAPASTAVFLSVAANVHGAQVQALDDVLRKFPIRDRLLTELRNALTDNRAQLRALLRTVGPQVDVAVLDTTGSAVAFTQPADEDAFERALKADTKTDWIVTRMHGWTAFTDDQAALDTVKKADEKLDDVDAYGDATAELPDEALVKAYVAGGAVREGAGQVGVARGTKTPPSQRQALAGLRWLSAAAFAHDDGVEVQVHANGKQLARKVTGFDSTLADEVPSGALAALSFRDLDKAVAQLQDVLAAIPGFGSAVTGLLPQLEKLGKVLSGESLLYVRAGNPIPEVTIVAKVDNSAEAERTVRGLVRSLAPASSSSRRITVDGVSLEAIDLGPVSVFSGAFDGKLVVSDNANAVRDLKGGGDKLADDKVFGDAKDAAGMPDETVGWLYLNAKDALPVAEGFAQISGARIPNEIDDNLRPLRSLLVFGSRDGDTLSFKAFLQTS